MGQNVTTRQEMTHVADQQLRQIPLTVLQKLNFKVQVSIVNSNVATLESHIHHTIVFGALLDHSYTRMHYIKTKWTSIEV